MGAATSAFPLPRNWIIPPINCVLTSALDLDRQCGDTHALLVVSLPYQLRVKIERAKATALIDGKPLDKNRLVILAKSEVELQLFAGFIFPVRQEHNLSVFCKTNRMSTP